MHALASRGMLPAGLGAGAGAKQAHGAGALPPVPAGFMALAYPLATPRCCREPPKAGSPVRPSSQGAGVVWEQVGHGGLKQQCHWEGLARTIGTSKMVSPYVPPEKAASLRAEAVLCRLLCRLSQDPAGATLGPRCPPLPAHPPGPYIKYLLVPNAVLVLLCPRKGQAADLGESWPCGHPPVAHASCPWGADTTSSAWRMLCAGNITPAHPGKVWLGGHVTVWSHLVFPSQKLPKERAAGWHPYPAAIPGGM